jgi:hypothetical protein
MSRIDGPLGKSERAKEQVGELARAIESFFATNPYVVGAEDDEAAGQYVYKIVKAEDPPQQLALIAGDVTHNLRASLDLLIWQLFEANGTTPDRSDAFPIVANKRIFDRRIVPVMQRRISNGAVRTLAAVRPYKGGNEDLWRQPARPAHRSDSAAPGGYAASAWLLRPHGEPDRGLCRTVGLPRFSAKSEPTGYLHRARGGPLPRPRRVFRT